MSVTQIRRLARDVGHDHDLALALWDTGVHEARILASILADPARVTPETADQWTASFDSWDIVDQFCLNLFWRLPFASAMVEKYCASKVEFVRRTGLSLVAAMAFKNKRASNVDLAAFIPLVTAAAARDDRNFVKKAASWALRQLGKRSPTLKAQAVAAAEGLRTAYPKERAARWVAADVLRELTGGSV